MVLKLVEQLVIQIISLAQFFRVNWLQPSEVSFHQLHEQLSNFFRRKDVYPPFSA